MRASHTRYQVTKEGAGELRFRCFVGQKKGKELITVSASPSVHSCLPGTWYQYALFDVHVQWLCNTRCNLIITTGYYSNCTDNRWVTFVLLQQSLFALSVEENKKL